MHFADSVPQLSLQALTYNRHDLYLPAARSVSSKVGSFSMPKDKLGKLVGAQGATISRVRCQTGMHLCACAAFAVALA